MGITKKTSKKTTTTTTTRKAAATAGIGASATSATAASAGLGSVSLASTPTQGSQAAYNQFIKQARALPKASVIVCNTDGLLAYRNALVGVASLVLRKVAAMALPGVNYAQLLLVPQMCLAVAYAAALAEQLGGPTVPDLPAVTEQANALRSNLLLAADALVSAKLLPAARVKALHRAHGGLETAKSLVGLAALFRENAEAIKGQTASVAADWTLAESLGSQLETLLVPKGAKKSRPTAQASAADDRDRLWTLAHQTHGTLWGVLAFLNNGPTGLDKLVPPLGAHVATTSARKTANAAKKAAAKAPAPPATT